MLAARISIPAGAAPTDPALRRVVGDLLREHPAGLTVTIDTAGHWSHPLLQLVELESSLWYHPAGRPGIAATLLAEQVGTTLEWLLPDDGLPPGTVY